MSGPGKASIDDVDVAGKRVLVRVDFNIPLSKGAIVDDRRIREGLSTIESLRKRNARVLLASHMGRPEGSYDQALSTRIPATRLSELLGVEVRVADDVAGDSATQLSASLADGQVGMIENVRFEAGEVSNDAELSRRLAALADLYCNDAFGTAHRAHSSTVGITKFLPSYAGHLMARELEVLGSALEDPVRPFVTIVGGAKISTKLGVIVNLIDKVDTLWVAGAMASTFYLAQGATVGRSLAEPHQIEAAAALLKRAGSTRADLRLPSDVVVAREPAEGSPHHVVPWNEIPDDEMVVDAGPETVAAISASFEGAGTVVWNGPLGIFEIDTFAAGTRKVAEALGRSQAITITGGGDLTAAIDHVGVAESINHVSTGGGATLEFLEGKELPGVVALQDRPAR